ncbi:hypothetical protein C2G38_2049453 [Gigaspora rosea]|uniref:Uncharacterized protein n=1 Tax=Gigaspora rosea TaxID=44941 RepID=A0A397U347_9GLOM|nr:hypothetical protein C2G38_2049453 [Gigaspora rosea]
MAKHGLIIEASTGAQSHEKHEKNRIVKWRSYINKETYTEQYIPEHIRWLLAFKAYMDAVLVLYENREQELNAYRDHINELCIKHDFLAVLGYDEDQRIALIMNRDITLLDRNIEAEGKNFDAFTAKRPRNEGWRPGWADTTWYNGKEICLNWNKKSCPEDKACSRVHACIVCKKLGHREKTCYRKGYKNKYNARRNNSPKSEQ